ncbi:MAG: superoxide dismutase [Alphaproteobacteria bacterium]
MAFELKPLPFPISALEPHMSAKTLSVHHGKHHRKYIDTLNKLVDGTPYASMSLTQIVRKSAVDRSTKAQKVFNNAAQAWNHDFFWQSLSPEGGGIPPAALARRIEATFGDLAGFKRMFKKAAIDQFGSGWAWLVARGGELKIVTTGNAQTPIADGSAPLLTCDVWEHAYYLDYQNKRDEFVAAFLDRLINWKFAAVRLAKEGE